MNLFDLLHVFVVTRGWEGSTISHPRSPICDCDQLRILLKHNSQPLEFGAMRLKILNEFCILRRVARTDSIIKAAWYAQKEEAD
jgi:hypothetical protein